MFIATLCYNSSNFDKLEDGYLKFITKLGRLGTAQTQAHTVLSTFQLPGSNNNNTYLLFQGFDDQTFLQVRKFNLKSKALTFRFHRIRHKTDNTINNEA